MARLFILIGLVFIAIGLAWWLAERFGLGRLPGDLVFEVGGARVYLPVATSILISIVLTAIFWLIGR